MLMHSRVYSIIWAVWAIVTLASFGVLEGYALATNWQNTLSAQIWRFERFQPGQPIGQWTFGHVMFIGLLLLFDVWLLMHFAMGWWRS